MTGVESKLLQIAEELNAAPDHPPLHPQFVELDVIDDSSWHEEPITAVFDPERPKDYLAVPTDLVVDLEEVQ